MAVRGEKERLNMILGSHLTTIHDTLQVLDQTPPSSLDKVNWEDVIKMGDQVSKQATTDYCGKICHNCGRDEVSETISRGPRIKTCDRPDPDPLQCPTLERSRTVGMLWTGEKPKSKAIEENMASYFNTLQGFLLLSHGSTVGAGPTLSSSIHASVKQVVDSSFRLMKETVSLYGSHSKNQKVSVPQFVGAVWEATSALKKTPVTNITAIGRGMTQVAVSVKDVLREMKELKPGSSDKAVGESCAETECEACDDNSSEGDLGNDLSPVEMRVAERAIVVVSDTLSVIKELIRSITGLLKLEKPNDKSSFVDSLEKLLQLCQELGRQIDEIGACLYPPQEIPSIEAAMEKIHSTIDVMQVELGGLQGASDVFLEACNALRSSLKQLASEPSSSRTADIEAKVENITLIN